MNEKEIYTSLDCIKPTQEQKDRMLNNILAQAKQKKVEPQKTSNVVSFRPRQWMYVAASLLVVVGVGSYVGKQSLMTPPSYMEQENPSYGQQVGVRKFMNYKGYRYVFLEEIPQNIDFSSLTNQLGQLESLLIFGETTDTAKEYATTFAQGGTIWESKDYNPDYRVVVEHEGQYYLCENVGRSDDTYFDLAHFFEAADFGERALGIEVSRRIDGIFITELDQQTSKALLEDISKSRFLETDQIPYEELASDEAREKSITLKILLSDETSLEIFATPSLRILSIGDNYYQISEAVQESLKGIMSNQ